MHAMIERFTIPPDAKARLAMRERRDAAHEPPSSSECPAERLHPTDDCEAESPSASPL
jgi:hypothetical protein